MTDGPDGVRDRPVIICYDGSRAAIEALEYIASVIARARAIVVTVWREVTEEMTASGTAPPAGDPAAANQQARLAADEAARNGVKRAQAAGLQAEALVVEATGPIWRAIDAVARKHDGLLIACGTGRSGIKTVLPGDVANALVQHASLPVLVVPTSKAAAERRRLSEKEEG